MCGMSTEFSYPSCLLGCLLLDRVLEDDVVLLIRTEFGA